jgi:polyphosphate glucokinase
MELGQLTIKKATFNDYLGKNGLARLGKKKWLKYVEETITRFISALELDDVVIGGGNAKKLKQVPPGCRLGSNANAFIGGFRLWQEPEKGEPSISAKGKKQL